MDVSERLGGRELRHRKHRRSFMAPGPEKRLFTPEIKRYLKSWLVRRRHHPYPNRTEKKSLAHQTGLTYMQICNWFANWRRKLKNTGQEKDTQTWTTLIKTYNGHAENNVELFSLSSSDSIWKEMGKEDNSEKDAIEVISKIKDIEISKKDKVKINDSQCFQISSTTNGFKAKENHKLKSKSFSKNTSNHTPLLLSRWLKSAAYFQPKKNSFTNYHREQFFSPPKFESKTSLLYENILSTIHGREELDAAEALTFMARASRGFH